MTITATTADAVFAAAANAAHWNSTNLGLVTDVNHGGDIWTVILPRQDDPARATRAEITWRENWGGAEYVGAPATWLQTMPIVDAALTVTRAH
ncbi:hypothetical protein [Kitasatospora cineracea]|uniref:hypothetical protein n=1 Tax=Kitasatospora cineracea TaxID=88074 RepID=UPI0033F160C5